VTPSTPITISDNGEQVLSVCTRADAVPPAGGASSKIALPPLTSGLKSYPNSYGQILKSSALVGGSQVVNIAIGIVRTKAMAMLLGPAGFGLFGLYGSIQNLTQSIAGMGINSSGVRQIAEAVGSGDNDRVSKTAAVLRRTAVVLGVLGATGLFVFSRQISRLTFGSADRSAAVSLLSVAVTFGLISGGQGALLQGMRRIADLAKMNVLSAFFGFCAAIPLVYLFRDKGVVASLVVVAATGILTSWWYTRKIGIQPTSVALSEVRHEACALLKLGSAFMASSLMTVGVAYAVRIIILRSAGFEATGLYQAAWTLGGLYVGFILQAMGADFYPRLTASIHDHEEANRIVNEQTLIGLMLAGPGVLATLTLAPLVIGLFYSAKFAAAVLILRWICLGAVLQVVTWPIGFIIVAKGNQVLFFAAEFAWTSVAICLAWLFLRCFGVTGAGMAFFGSYVFHILLIYPIVRRLTGFRWSDENKQNGAIFSILISAVFLLSYVRSPGISATLGTLIAGCSAVYSIRRFLYLVPVSHVPASMKALLRAFRRFSRTASNHEELDQDEHN
jgi:enterobacterial common antigen flippase